MKTVIACLLLLLTAAAAVEEYRQAMDSGLLYPVCKRCSGDAGTQCRPALAPKHLKPMERNNQDQPDYPYPDVHAFTALPLHADWRKDGSDAEKLASLTTQVPGAAHWMAEMGERYQNIYWAAMQE